MFVRLKETAQHTLVFGIGTVFRQSLNFFLVPLYTRILPTEEYGLLGILILLTTLAGLIPQSAFGPSLFRSYYDYEDEHKQSIVLSTNFFLTLFTSGIIALLGWLLSEEISTFFTNSAAYASLFKVIFLTSMINSLGVVAMTVFRIKKWSVRYVIASILALLAQLGTTIYLVVILKWGVYGVIWGIFIGAIANAMFLFTQIWKQLKPSIQWTEVRKMTSYGFPFIPEALIAMAVSSSDRFFLERFGSLSQVGVYFLGLQIAQILDLIIYGPYNLIEPVVIFSAEKQADAPQFYARLLTYMLGIGIFIGLGLSCLAQDTIQIISNPAYWPAYQVVPLLMIFTIFKGVRALGGVGLSLRRKTAYFPIAIGIGLGLNILLMLILVPLIGMIGAAIAMAATYILVFLARMVFGHRYYPVPVEWGRIMKLFGVAAIIFTASQAIQVDSIWISFLVRGLLSLSFPVWLWLVRFFRPEESVRLNLIFHQALRYIKVALLKESSMKA